MKPVPDRHRSFRITIILALAIGGMVFLSTGSVLLLAERAAFRNTLELLRSAGLLAVDRVVDATGAHMRPALAATDGVATMTAKGELDLGDHGQVQLLLRGMLASSPQLSAIGVWDENLNSIRVVRTPEGDTVSSTGSAAGDVTVIRLLNALRQSGKAEWGPPIYRDGQTYVNVGRSLYRDGRYLGAVASGVSVRELSSFVSGIARSLEMTGFILYGDDLALAHPELGASDRPVDATADIPLLPVNRLGDDVIKQVKTTEPINDPENQGFTVRSIVSEGQRYLVLSRTLATFGNVPWQIGIYAPIENTFSQVRRLIGSILAGLVIMVLSIAAAVLLARRVARPINRIAAASEQVGQLEIDAIEPLPRSWISELDKQAMAFNRMIEGLKWFETYVPRRLVSRLIAGHDSTSIRSREANLTVMFTDLIGFTQTSQNMTPDAIAAMLNEHFEVIGQCIEAEGGTVDKYIGDAVMAFWGAPEDQPDHAARACRAAIAIARSVEANNSTTVHPRNRMKIAIHSGPVIVGNIGASSRINYTVVGDTVNTCSRIETLCREFDDGRTAIVLVSQDTAAQAGDGFDFTPVGKRAVKGRDSEVTLCRLET